MNNLTKGNAMRLDTEQERKFIMYTISSEEVEAAAKAWLHFQFQGKWTWESAAPALKEKFREGAKQILVAAAIARRSNI
jgi:hypothetical protein